MTPAEKYRRDRALASIDLLEEARKAMECSISPSEIDTPEKREQKIAEMEHEQRLFIDKIASLTDPTILN